MAGWAEAQPGRRARQAGRICRRNVAPGTLHTPLTDPDSHCVPSPHVAVTSCSMTRRQSAPTFPPRPPPRSMHCVRYDCDGSELLLDVQDPDTRLEWDTSQRQRRHEAARRAARRPAQDGGKRRQGRREGRHGQQQGPAAAAAEERQRQPAAAAAPSGPGMPTELAVKESAEDVFLALMEAASQPAAAAAGLTEELLGSYAALFDTLPPDVRARNVRNAALMCGVFHGTGQGVRGPAGAKRGLGGPIAAGASLSRHFSCLTASACTKLGSCASQAAAELYGLLANFFPPQVAGQPNLPHIRPCLANSQRPQEQRIRFLLAKQHFSGAAALMRAALELRLGRRRVGPA